MKADPMTLLRRKAEIVCKIHKKQGNYAELIAKLQGLASQPASTADDIIKSKEFAMYMFELLAEYHLPQDLIVSNQDSFMQLFSHSMEDTNPRVRVATLKALTSFITSIEDEELVMKYQAMMGNLLNIVIEVLKTDEEQGRQSLTSLIDLTQSYADIWQGCKEQLLFVCSEIMKAKGFEDATRSCALEIIQTVADENPKLLKGMSAKIQSEFFPALAIMLTCCSHEEDLQEWADEPETEILAKNDPSSVAAEALLDISSALGDKITIMASSQLINEAIKRPEWQYRQAGYLFLAMIAESCAKIIRMNLDEIFGLIFNGLSDSHPRVRYQALTALGLVLNETSPLLQHKHHALIMP
jgi:hypothetical protein